VQVLPDRPKGAVWGAGRGGKNRPHRRAQVYVLSPPEGGEFAKRFFPGGGETFSWEESFGRPRGAVWILETVVRALFCALRKKRPPPLVSQKHRDGASWAEAARGPKRGGKSVCGGVAWSLFGGSGPFFRAEGPGLGPENCWFQRGGEGFWFAVGH